MKRIFTPLAVIVLALIIAGCDAGGAILTCTDWSLTDEETGTIYIPSDGPSDFESVAMVIRITDGDGTTLYSYTFTIDESSIEDDILEFAEVISDDGTIPYTVLPDYNPITFRIYIVLDGVSMRVFEDSGNCSGLPTLGTTTGGDPNIVYPPDNRINWQYGDLEVVVYSHEEGTVVYCYQDGAWLGMLINQAVIDNAPTGQAQDVPVLEAAGCNAAFYILDSGEYQINIWTHEGKLYELISDSLDFTNARKRYFDPNE